MGLMNRIGAALALAFVAYAFDARPAAQLLNAAAPVRVGHYHLNVTSVEEHRKFWVETLGGTATRVGSVEAVRFGDVFLFLRPQRPTGPTRGTTFDHIGLAVPNVPEFTARVVARGYQLTVGREILGQVAPAPPAPGTSAVYGRFSYLLGPDGVKVELVTSATPDAPPIAHHHVHFVNREFVAMQQWYMKALNATLRDGQTDFFIGADLPGVGYMLNFFSWLPAESLVGTAGRAVDHVGFEVRDLEAFCAELVAKGIALATPYRRDAELGVAVATLRDPWGTMIELTEGLRD